MLIAVNIGNSVISVGFFDDTECSLISSFKLSTDIKKTSDEYLASIEGICSVKKIDLKNISGAIISSVVPQLTEKIKNTLTELCGFEPTVVGPGVKTGFRIKIDNPSELGGDMVANAAAAISKGGAAGRFTVIADLGAVNTVSAINEKGEYVGCSIFPGISMSLEALHGNTAQLPNVNASSTSKAIGKNSQSSICSGVFLGSAFALDGFIRAFALEMRCKAEQLRLISTGEFAKTVTKSSEYKFEYDGELTLKGLYCIYKNNIKE